MRSRKMSEQVRSQTVLAYWLLPASPAREFLRETIRRLAGLYDAPAFEPHLTLAVGPDSTAEAQRILAGIAAEPIGLHASGVHFTTKFTQTLFVRFDSVPELERLRNSLGLAGGEVFVPHVSLLYARLPEGEQAQLAATLKLPFQTAWFDALQAVRCRVPVTTSADVTSWEIVASRHLQPSHKSQSVSS